MNQYQVLAHVRNNTGQNIKIGMFESIDKWLITETQITILVQRARVKVGQRTDIVTHRGQTVYQWNLINQKWIAVEPVTVWWSTVEKHVPAETRVDDDGSLDN